VLAQSWPRHEVAANYDWLLGDVPARQFWRHMFCHGATSICFALCIAAVSPSARAQTHAATSPGNSSDQASVTSATFNFAPNDPPGEWRSQARDYANTRYSTLDQINTGNVAKLRMAWTFSDGTLNGHEAAPLVVDNTMYVVTPFPDILYALDLTRAGEPIKWTFEPNPSPIPKGKACCDTVTRGVAYAHGKLIYNLLDDHTVAVDAFLLRKRRDMLNPNHGRIKEIGEEYREQKHSQRSPG
jgi:glucose dehydrogenase